MASGEIPSRSATSPTVRSRLCRGGVVGMLYARRMKRTACAVNCRPAPVWMPAACSCAAISALVCCCARRAISAIVSGGVRVVSLWVGGRVVVCCSAAPERQRIPIRSSLSVGWEVIVTSAMSARSSRLRSLWVVLLAAHSAGTRARALRSARARVRGRGWCVRRARPRRPLDHMEESAAVCRRQVGTHHAPGVRLGGTRRG